MTRLLTMGILETDRPAEDHAATFGDYPAMFEGLLCEFADSWEFRHYAVFEGELPERDDECDAWLITGSRFSAYEEYEWIGSLKDHIRAAYAGSVPIVGICFGHQVMAEALGGRVEKSEQGWVCGRCSYTLENQPVWMNQPSDGFIIQAFHQDQVVELPPDARVIGRSDLCDYAVLTYGDRALSFQGHPEFQAPYVEALLQARRGTLIPEEVADKALTGVRGPLDSARVASWIRQFIANAIEKG